MGGKHGSDHVTIYQNMHVLVLFKNPLDNTVIHTIAQCISRGKKYGELVDMLHHVLDHHRYIVIMGDLKTSPKLKFLIFLLQIPYLIRLFVIWKNKILAEKKSFPCVMSPPSVESLFTFTMAKYAKNRNYVPPSKGKTVLVHPSKDKDVVVKQDWDEYIGHGLNNKHWVLEKSKWSNPFYTPKLSAKICNERYRRHI